MEEELRKAQEESLIKGVTTIEGIPRFTHQQFVDDMILTRESSLEEASNFKHIIITYMEASGERLNEEKSEIMFLNMDPNV